MAKRKSDGTMAITEVFFNHEIESILIDEVQKHPVLWKQSHPYFLKTKIKSAIFEDIAKILEKKFPGHKYNSALCMAKWQSMKGYFFKQYRKVQPSVSPGDPEFGKLSKYVHFERLLFTKDMTTSESYNNLESDVPSPTSSVPPIHCLKQEEEDDADDPFTSTTMAEESSAGTSSSSQTFVLEEYHTKKQRRKAMAQPDLEKANAILQQHLEPQVSHPADAFGKFVASMLHKMPEEMMKEKIGKITNVLME